VTTYSTLKAEFQNKTKKSLLHSVDWYRIVLDEGWSSLSHLICQENTYSSAHIIRRRATLFYRSCDDLHANSRWCLTGTPIQNKLTDIGTLFAFIRAEPFSKAAVFRKWIEVPFEQSTDDSTGATAVKDRLVMLIEALCLRRTKEVIELPEVQSCTRELPFTLEERKQYENTKKILIRMISHRVGEVDKSSHFGTFQMNLQMRLLCNHGTYQKPFSWRRHHQDEREAAISALGRDSEIYCLGCQSPMPVLGSSWLRIDHNKRCNHMLCSECIDESSGRERCPVCPPTLGPELMENNESTNGEDGPDGPVNDKAKNSDDYYFREVGHSTKMEALIQDVEQGLNETKR
jgi:SWI/SNF-related matrix-associated actin-dependent regulator of chromatin subfamily A3